MENKPSPLRILEAAGEQVARDLDVIPKIEHMEKVFEACTAAAGVHRKLLRSQAYYRQPIWVAWLSEGWYQPELELVVQHIQKVSDTRTLDGRKIRDNMLTFKYLIANCQRFQELLEDAQAKKRNEIPPATTKDAAQRATGRPTDREAAQEKGPTTPRHEIARLFGELGEKLKKGEL